MSYNFNPGSIRCITAKIFGFLPSFGSKVMVNGAYLLVLCCVYRPHDQFNLKFQDSNRRLIEEVNRRVFMVFLRLSTHKESKVSWVVAGTFIISMRNCYNGACGRTLGYIMYVLSFYIGTFYIAWCVWWHCLPALLIWYSKNIWSVLYLWARKCHSIRKDDFKYLYQPTTLFSRLNGQHRQYLWGLYFVACFVEYAYVFMWMRSYY